MTEFVDPRSNPRPPAHVSREPAAHGEDIRDLIRLCSTGRVYDVEHWIQGGRPIQALNYKRPRKAAVLSPLRTAIRKKHRDLVLLLMCNGYRLDLEGNERNSVLDEALTLRAFDIVDLLLEWGADPSMVSTYNVIDTYRTELIDTFWKAGVAYSTDPEFVLYLAHTVNKPLYGWLRRNRSDQRLQDALDVALLEAVTEDEELPVRLLLWAGANPHRKVPMARELGRPEAWDEYAVFSGATAAITFGRHRLFDLLRIETMPDLDAQFSWAHDSWTLKKLVAIRPPSSWSETILAFIGRLWRPFGLDSSWDVRDALGFIASREGKLNTVSPDQITFLRHVLLKVRETDTFLWLLRWLKNQRHCLPAIYEEVCRTASMREKIKALEVGARYLCPSQKTAHSKRHRGRTAKHTKKVKSKHD
jgi:hypothetical protein